MVHAYFTHTCPQFHGREYYFAIPHKMELGPAIELTAGIIVIRIQRLVFTVILHLNARWINALLQEIGKQRTATIHGKLGIVIHRIVPIGMTMKFQLEILVLSEQV